MFEYVEKVNSLVNRLVSTQEEALIEASRLVAETIKNDKIVHTIGTGHSQMIAMEMFGRASNLAHVNTIMDDLVLLAGGARRSAEIEQISGLAEIIWKNYSFGESDVIIIISNSGRNAIPIEMALKARKEGLKVIAITSLEQSKKYPSRHKSGKKLYQIADVIIDNQVPSGDGILNAGDRLYGPVSSVLGIFIVNIISTEAIKFNIDRGVEVPIFQSQNIDETGTGNDHIYERLESRVKHF